MTYDGSALLQRFNAPALPTAVMFTPLSGFVGDTVHVLGLFLAGTTRVEFNGVPTTNISHLTATRFDVVVPAGATTGPVTVVNGAGLFTTTAVFTVLRPVPQTGFTPAPFALNAPWTGSIAVTFAEPVNAPGTGSASLGVFPGMSSGRAAGTLAGSGTTTLTWTPAAPFTFGEVVQVTTPATLPVSAPGGRVRPRVTEFTVAAAGTGQGVLQTGTFHRSSNRWTYAAALGDLDGDRDLDLVTGNSDQSSLDIHFNDSRGNFAAPVLLQFTPGTFPRAECLKLADLDRDGDLDVVATGDYSSSIHGLFNQGNGTFGAPVDLDGAAQLGGELVFPGDVDADGDLDLVGLYPGTLTLVRNQGNGTFTPTSPQPFVRDSSAGQMYLHGAALRDFDNDGDLDILAGVRADSLVLGLNNGVGGFTTLRVTADPLAHRMFDFAPGDVDGDGDLDLVAAYDDSPLQVWVNDGAGHFAVARTFPGVQYSTQMGLADFDADGDLDLLVSSYGGPAQARVFWLNDGTGTFARQSMTPTTGFYNVRPMPIGDLDRDGDLDVMAVDAGRDLVEPWFNGGTGPLLGTPTAAPVARAQLFPNPAHAFTTLNLSSVGHSAHAAVELRDALGRCVRTYPLGPTEKMQLDLRGLPPGVYAVRLAGESGGPVLRLVVE